MIRCHPFVRLSHTVRLLGWSVAVLSLLSQLPAGESAVNFQQDILPLLTDRCLRCHGPDAETREAGLRLDDPGGAVAELDGGGRAIVPGQPDQSELIERIYSTDEDLRMPPASTGLALSADERQLFRRWIEQGAVYESHWSFVAPVRPAIPALEDTWVRNPIDQFVLRRLRLEGLSPQAPADRHRLARRASLALTGIPPTIDRADAFVADSRPQAYERFVDQLLHSSAYGERWARTWLDLARYADSAGYAQDPPRTIWRYRDWVIDAINRNVAFDQFTIQQLAGDLLVGADDEMLIATAFHRNTMTNSEGGTDDEEFRSAAIVDRVNTTMQVWMGLTMGCAQCHDHKYDPLTQEEYYKFYALLNNTEDTDRGDEAPTLATFTRRQQLTRERLQRGIAAQEEIVKQLGERSPRLPERPIRPRIVRVELPGKEKFLSLAEVEIYSGNKNIALGATAKQSSVAYEGSAKLAIDGNTDGDFNANSTTHSAAENDPWWEVDLGQPAEVQRIVVWNRTDNDLHSRLSNCRLVLLDSARRPIWVKNIAAPPSPSAEFTIPAASEDFDADDRAALSDYLRTNPDSPARKKLVQLRQQLDKIKGVPTPVLRELPTEKRRQTHIHVRGNFLVKGEEVTPGTPVIFPPLPAGMQPDRLALASWLVSPRNPLTARVVVNRFWEQLFGSGLVDTSEDFGRQGNLPSHPDLLDYLATALVDHDWDTKWLVREIVTSATYRQSAEVSPELARRDPHNRLLARGPRFRLSAEMIRDQALAVSGLLSDKMFGPSVQPPRPNLGLRAAFGGSTDWKTSEGEDRYRRGLYTSWRRTTPYPSMTTFDAPSREFCTVKRIRTNTPLQALVTLNDPVYVEAAQALARRIVHEAPGDSVAHRAAYGFRLCVLRPPQDAEVKRLVTLYEQADAQLQQRPERAERLATNPLGPVPGGDNVFELAKWTVVGNVLLNLDEVLSR